MANFRNNQRQASQQNKQSARTSSFDTRRNLQVWLKCSQFSDIFAPSYGVVIIVDTWH